MTIDLKPDEEWIIQAECPVQHRGRIPQELSAATREQHPHVSALRFSGIRGDGQTIWNFSLLRNYSIGEVLKTQFRAEAYNAFNRPVFDLPSTTVTSSAFWHGNQLDF